MRQPTSMSVGLPGVPTRHQVGFSTHMFILGRSNPARRSHILSLTQLMGAEQKTHTSRPQLAAHLRCTAWPQPHLQCTQCASRPDATAVCPPPGLPLAEALHARLTALKTAPHAASPSKSVSALHSHNMTATATATTAPATLPRGCASSSAGGGESRSSWQKAHTSPASTGILRTGGRGRTHRRHRSMRRTTSAMNASRWLDWASSMNRAAYACMSSILMRREPVKRAAGSDSHGMMKRV